MKDGTIDPISPNYSVSHSNDFRYSCFVKYNRFQNVRGIRIQQKIHIVISSSLINGQRGSMGSVKDSLASRQRTIEFRTILVPIVLTHGIDLSLQRSARNYNDRILRRIAAQKLSYSLSPNFGILS